MTDPLAGQREAINGGRDFLEWHATKKPPVKVGDVFELRSCGIEITRIHRVHTKGQLWGRWHADFLRFERESRPYFIGPHGYTHDPNLATKAQDDPNASTLDRVSDDDREERHRAAGEAPEPEAIPPEDVRKLPSTMEARLRYINQRDDLREAEQRRQLERAIRARLRDAIGGLRPEAQAALLARVEREIEAAMVCSDAA